MSDLRSLGETASFFAVSVPTLRRWIEGGCPVAERGSSGVAYKLDLRAVAEWRRGQREADAEAERQRAERDAQLRLELLGDQALTVQDGEALTPRQRADALQEELARTRLAVLRRELTSAEEMKLDLGDALAMLKTRLRQIPDVVAPDIGLSEPQAARLGDLIDEALNDAADALEAAFSDASP